MNRCNVCANYLDSVRRCKFCHFEWADELRRDDWDILNEEDAWCDEYSIRNRLWANGIECLSADIWGGNDMAIVYGYSEDSSRLASILGVDKDVIYVDPLHDISIINLFEEKMLRENVR